MLFALVLENENDLRHRYYWFATIFAPFGCALRWKLSNYNFKLQQLPWLPTGTFIANQLACIIDIIIEVILLKVSGISTVTKAAMFGIQTGFAGSLSTVSTWMMEIRIAGKEIPNNYFSYWYIFLTVGTSIIFGLIIYGSGLWTD
eukprot:TRINITY_DN3875_c1_g1_i1.p2 TRINITY_DN3875_c1_g1~~TRINITY_DN3875_c1_g1_i1.p2  ORF type:complete len:166 (-),score=13.73 TRINITY_DN3875_c1_g1_i1:364-798(-)